MSAASKNASQTAIASKPARAPKPDKADAKMAEMLAEVARLREENAALAAKAATKTAGRQPFARVTEKGGVSFYFATGRFPITLYAEQWETVFACQDIIKAALALPTVKRGGRNADA